MALAPLAAAADLQARGIVNNFPQVDTYLATASAEVRAAAGSPISQTTSTVTLSGYHGDPWLRLPGPPVSEVVEVEVDGQPVTDWKLADGRLWRAAGWATGYGPSEIRVTYTHGLPQVPEHIVDLVCSMVAAAKSALEEDDDGLGLALDNGRLQSVTIDGFTETFSTSGEAVAAVTAMLLPDRTRRWLAAQFGGSAGTVTSR